MKLAIILLSVLVVACGPGMGDMHPDASPLAGDASASPDAQSPPGATQLPCERLPGYRSSFDAMGQETSRWWEWGARLGGPARALACYGDRAMGTCEDPDAPVACWMPTDDFLVRDCENAHLWRTADGQWVAHCGYTQDSRQQGQWVRTEWAAYHVLVF